MRRNAPLFAILGLLILAAATNSVGAKSPSFEELRQFLLGGGDLLLAEPSSESKVTLTLSSEFVINETNGPDHGKTVRVYHGDFGDAGAVVVVKDDVVTISMQRADGYASRLIIGKNKAEYVAPPDSVSGPIEITQSLGVLADPSGTPQVMTDVLHASPPGGHSIQFLKHIRTQQTSGNRADPVNVVFYQTGYSGNIRDVLLDGNWAGTGCGSGMWFGLYDAMHGGTDQWYPMLEQWKKEGVTCSDPRYHLRMYAKSSGAWTDVHVPAVPGFKDYGFGPVHWEDWNHQNSNPTRGQDKLIADISPSTETGNIRWAQTTNSGTDCGACGAWNGKVYFVQVWPPGGGSGDSCNKIPTYTIQYPSDWMIIKWSC